MPVRLRQIDAVSEAGSAINADRCGLAGALAWVIDGATDVGCEKLLPHGSDAAWFAAAVDDVLTRLGRAGDCRPLPDLLDELTRVAGERFVAERLRAPRAVHEHPSAAAVLMRLVDADEPILDVLALADCQCVLGVPGRAPVRLSPADTPKGDPIAVGAISAYRAEVADRPIADVRASILPMLRNARDRLNQPGGYGVLSVLPVPAEFIQVERASVPIGSRVLLASDGFTRLSEVFGLGTTEDLLPRADREGLAAMVTDLRARERADADCRQHQRTKTHDDATALLLEVTAD